MKYVIDRIEEGTAILEGYDGERLEMEAGLLPKGAGEGASVMVEGEKVVLFKDEERERRIAEKMKAVWRK
jgi:hypothetical protein